MVNPLHTVSVFPSLIPAPISTGKQITMVKISNSKQWIQDYLFCLKPFVVMQQQAGAEAHASAPFSIRADEEMGSPPSATGRASGLLGVQNPQHATHSHSLNAASLGW